MRVLKRYSDLEQSSVGQIKSGPSGSGVGIITTLLMAVASLVVVIKAVRASYMSCAPQYVLAHDPTEFILPQRDRDFDGVSGAVTRRSSPCGAGGWCTARRSSFPIGWPFHGDNDPTEIIYVRQAFGACSTIRRSAFFTGDAFGA